jgi:DNA-binding transcriptional LysR family regulator
MLDLRLLHQAVTLARHRNFARAAESLRLTQPALSRSIAGLEASLGEKLFNRTQQGVEPTAFGQMLLSRAQTLLEGATELERDFQLMRGLDIGELRVGAGAYPAEISVGQAAGQLISRHPGLRVDVATTDLRVLVEGVLTRRLDLAVVELSTVDGDSRINTEALPKHPGCFYCRAGHPLAAQKNPTKEQVFAFPFAGPRMTKRVAGSFLNLAKAGTIDPDSGDYLPPIKVDSIRVAKEVVKFSDAIGVAPLPLIAAEIAAGRLVALALQLPWMHTGYGFVYLRDRALSPAAQAFMIEVRSVEDEIVTREQGLKRPVAARKQRGSNPSRRR